MAPVDAELFLFAGISKNRIDRYFAARSGRARDANCRNRRLCHLVEATIVDGRPRVGAQASPNLRGIERAAPTDRDDRIKLGQGAYFFGEMVEVVVRRFLAPAQVNLSALLACSHQQWTDLA